MCYVEIEVNVDGEVLGTTPFRVDYKPGRIADQNNMPTVLKWGGPLGSKLRRENHTDEFAVLEKLSNGAHRLSIQAAEPGDFIA